MPGTTYTPEKQVFETFPHIVAEKIKQDGKRKIIDFRCNINDQSCISARGGMTTETEIINIMSTAEIPGCRTNCPIFKENFKKLQSFD